MMKIILKLGSVVMIVLLVLATSCGDDDDPCTETTWYQDADGDGLGNADVPQDACEAPEGFVADNTDPDDNCTTTPSTFYRDLDGDGLGDPDSSVEACEAPEGYVSNSDDVGDCFPGCQDFGSDSPLGIFWGGFETIPRDGDGNILWESDPENGITFADVVSGAATQGKWDDNAQINGSDAVDPIQGVNYASLIRAAGEGGKQNRIGYQPAAADGTLDDPEVAQEDRTKLDLSGYTDPYVNLWVHTEGDSAALQVGFNVNYYDTDGSFLDDAYWTYQHDDGAGGTSNVLYFKYDDWTLLSFPLNAASWEDEFADDGVTTRNFWTEADLDQVDRVRFSFDTRLISENNPFTLHIDAASISEGPLTDVRNP